MASFAASKKEERRGAFKKGVDADLSRRTREETTVQIRKEKRHEHLNRRRKMTSGMEGEEQPPTLEDPVLRAKLENLQVMVQRLRSPDPTDQLESMTNFRKLLSIERNPPIQEVIAAGAMPDFVRLLGRDDHSQLQFEAAWALTNIASGNSEHTRFVIDSGALPTLVHLLRSPNLDVREQAVWALGNVAGDSAPCRDLVLGTDALHVMLQLLGDGSNKISMLRNTTWTLSNFCRGKPPPQFSVVRMLVPKLAQLICMNDEEVLTDACWALSYLSDDDADNIQAIVESGICQRLVELLMHPSLTVQTPALRTVGNIVTGDDLQTQIMINVNVLPSAHYDHRSHSYAAPFAGLHALLGSPKKGIRREACWTISNITAGLEEQISHVFHAELVPELINLLSSGDFDIRKEAAWALANACRNGNSEHVKYLVQTGIIPPFCRLLAEPDVAVVMQAMDAIKAILSVGLNEARHANASENPYALLVDEAEGLEAIEKLQHSHNEIVYEKAVSLLEDFFHPEQEDEDQNVAPVAHANSFQFGMQPQATGGVTF